MMFDTHWLGVSQIGDVITFFIHHVAEGSLVQSADHSNENPAAAVERTRRLLPIPNADAVSARRTRHPDDVSLRSVSVHQLTHQGQWVDSHAVKISSTL